MNTTECICYIILVLLLLVALEYIFKKKPESAPEKQVDEGFIDVRNLSQSGKDKVCAIAAQNVDKTCGGDARVRKRLFFGPKKGHNDVYYMQKVSGGVDKHSLRMTLNDNPDEALEIWGDSCRHGGCAGPGRMAHKFRADGDASHRGTLAVGKLHVNNGGDVSGVNGNAIIYDTKVTNGVHVFRLGGQEKGRLHGGGFNMERGQMKVNIPSSDPLPRGWGGGVHSWDVYAKASVGAGRSGNGAPRAVINSRGQLCLDGVCIDRGDLQRLKNPPKAAPAPAPRPPPRPAPRPPPPPPKPQPRVEDTSEDGMPRSKFSPLYGFAVQPKFNVFHAVKCYPIKQPGRNQTFIRVERVVKRNHFGKDVIWYRPVHPSIHPLLKSYTNMSVGKPFNCP